MKGILAYDTKWNDGVKFFWKVVYPKNILSNKVFQTGELPLHPSLPYGAIIEEGEEVEFEAELLNGEYYAKIMHIGRNESSKQETWDDIANKFTDERNVDLTDSKLSFIPFLNWLKRNYKTPEAK